MTPITLYYTLFFAGSVGLFALYSFYRFANYDFTADLNLDNYKQALTGEAFRTLMVRTVIVAVIVALLVVAISFAFVCAAHFVFPRRRALLYFLVLVSLFSGYLVRIYAWRTILGAEGVINATLLDLHAIRHPLRFLLNGWFAVAVALTNFLIPLGVLPIDAAMQNVSPRTLEAARDLGASRTVIVRRVLLPLTLRGVVVAFAFALIGTAADFVTPALLGGVSGQLIGTAIQAQFGTTLDWPLGAALSFTTMIVVAVLVALFALVMRRVVR